MNDTAQTLADQVRLTVDYGQSLEAMIAAGHYDWTNPYITAERFPMECAGTVQIEARLFHFDHYLLSECAVDAIKTADPVHPWEPAKIEHLLSFGASHPDERVPCYRIVALGSVAEVFGGRGVPYLHGDSSLRGIVLAWWDSDWSDGYRVLAVRNRSSGA